MSTAQAVCEALRKHTDEAPWGRDKQRRGILGDAKAITNRRVSCAREPAYVFHQHFCSRGQAIWKIQPDSLCKAQGDPWQHNLLSKHWMQLFQSEPC